MGDRQWPDPRGWEALTQAEADADVRARVLRWTDSGGGDVVSATDYDRLEANRDYEREVARMNADTAERYRDALAVAERERDEAREALRQIDEAAFDDNVLGIYRCQTIRAITRAALAGGPQT